MKRILMNDEITIENIQEIFSLSYETELCAPNVLRLKKGNSEFFLMLNKDNHLIYLFSWYKFTNQSTFAERIIFVNEMNISENLKCNTIKIFCDDRDEGDNENKGALDFRYDIVLTSEVNLGELLKTVGVFCKISHTVIDYFIKAFPDTEDC